MQLIEDIKQLGDFINDLTTTSEVSVDIESTGLDCFRDTLILLQVGLDKDIYVFDCRKIGKKTLTYVVDLLSSKSCIGHNIKFDIKFLKSNTGILLTNIHDTMIYERLITNGIGKVFYSLKDVVEKYCSVSLDKETRNEFINNPDIIITEEVLIYSALDVKYLKQIKDLQLKILEEQKQLAVAELERSVLPVIADMEFSGVLLDRERWNKYVQETGEKSNILRKELMDELINKILEYKQFTNALEVVEEFSILPKTKLSKKTRTMLEGITELSFIRDYLYNNFNPDSTKQLTAVLVKVYKIGEYSRRGEFEPIESTNEKIIDKFAVDFPIIDKIIAYREQSKLVSTFGQNFTDAINSVTGRIHTDFNQLGAQSGRLSSSGDINLCNIPANNDIRNCFIARPGYKIVGHDFSQEELRLMSVFEPKLAEAFIRGEDPHSATAAQLYEKNIEEVTKEERRRGKTLNFAVGYGSTAWGLYKNFKIPQQEGEKLLDRFYNQVYTSLRDVKNKSTELIWKNLVSQTFFGRKRYFKKSSIFETAKEFEKEKAKIGREGFNHTIQGTGADVMKMSLRDIFYQNKWGEDLKILIQVYDEIVCEVKEEYAEEAQKFIYNIMKSNLQKFLNNIPAEVDYYIEPYWKK
jgi:DNA polymerase-1